MKTINAINAKWAAVCVEKREKAALALVTVVGAIIFQNF